jgi:AcrR family transcriptional regulator
VGSFYARFGDRQGLLLAVQDRFLDRVEAAALAQAGTLLAVDDLREVLEQLVAAFLEVFRTNRNAFNAILIQSLSIQSFRDRGALASQEGARAFTEILIACGAQVTHPDPALAADFTFRTLFALATHIVMMDEGEVTGAVLEQQQWVDQTTDMLHLYLGADRSG